MSADGPDVERQPLVTTASQPSTTRETPDLLQQRRGWKERYFSAWRRAFMYHCNPWFGESLEISFRVAVWLLLFSIPILWGTDEERLWVNEHKLSGAMLNTGACLCAVYTTAPTIGRTLRNVFGGVTGVFTAAAYSRVMYLVYPNGCSFVDSFDFCYVFGVLAGATSMWLVLLLRLDLTFKIFYCANFVGFWMAFLNPLSPLRDHADFPTWTIGGFEFRDWGVSSLGGSGVFGGVMSMVSGSIIATVATLLPYPMTSIDKARDSAFKTVNVIETTWRDAYSFYFAEDKDEQQQAKMLRIISDMRDHVDTLQEQLDATSWEMCFLWHCGRSWRLTHAYLTELEGTTSRCFDRLSHVVAACMHENFDPTHDEFVKPERCGNAAKALVDSSNNLFSYAMKCVEDGNVGNDEKEQLLRGADGVEEDVKAVTRKMKAAIKDIKEMELGKRASSPNKIDPEKVPRTVSAGTVLEDTAVKLNEEQIFIFSLCDFARRVQRYSRWLAEQNDPPSWQARDLFGWLWREGKQEIFNRDVIMSRDNLNSTLRHSLSVFAAFAIGYSGYSEVLPEKSAILSSTVCVLQSQSIAAPIKKSLGRLQGVVVGKFAGLLTYALLGWCSSWAQASMSAIVFSYVFLFLFVYNYTSPYSYLGCLAAALGTAEFLKGCSDEVVGGATLASHATDLGGMLLAIVLMTVIDMTLHVGLPSDLAYVAYVDAWKMWDSALEQLLLTGADVQLDLQGITAAIDRAEALADEAESNEPRLWKPPFPGHLFSEMIEFARTMRTQVICIRTVVCKDAVVYGKDSHDETASFPKKEWFKDLLEDEGWPEEIRETLKEIDDTFDKIKQVAAQNGQTLSIDRRPRQSQEALKAGKKFAMNDSDDERSLVDSKMTQASFIYGCLQAIKTANKKLRLAVIQKGLAS